MSDQPPMRRLGVIAPASYDAATGTATRASGADAADLAGEWYAVVGEVAGAAPFTHLIRTAGGATYLAELRPLQRV